MEGEREEPRSNGARVEQRARRTGRLLFAIGVPLAVVGGAALGIVIDVIPLEPFLPDTVRMTGPVVADWRATFWVGVVPVVGTVAALQGAWQMKTGRRSWRRLALLLALGLALLGAFALARRG